MVVYFFVLKIVQAEYILYMSVIKVILFFLIFIACTYVGLIISNKYKNRVRDLKEFKSVLNIISTKIRYTYEPIKEIAKDISNMNKTNIGKIFEEFYTQLNEKTITDAWNDSIEKTGNNFSKEDKSIIKYLGKMLGKTDIEGQVSQIIQTNEFINIQIDKAEKERQKNEKLYRSLGIIIGFVIIIILI